MFCKKNKKQRSIAQMPRPVHPRPVNQHGLFGMSFVNQHWMADDDWVPNSLTEQFKGMGEFLSKRLEFATLENKESRKSNIKESRNLKRQCRDGRAKLHLVQNGFSTLKIRNCLINHKDMQRLYQKMPAHQVMDKINQRTFVMRKERDRLAYRLTQLKDIYANQLAVKANLENRIKYQNEFELEEEKKSRTFQKRITNSQIRLKAIKTINNTYKKMIQVLRHDAIFYDPILVSLTKDTEDLATFIKHILFLGQPMLEKFKELSEEYRRMEEKSRKNGIAKLTAMQNYRAMIHRKSNGIRAPKSESVEPPLKRYMRETPSMLFLKTELDAIEDTIKQVKYATLCSQAKEIYPRIKSQMENNFKLKKHTFNNMLGFQSFENKLKRATVLSGVLVNNLSEEELARVERIRLLKEAIAGEDRLETEIIKYMKQRGDCSILFRFCLWNMSEILRHVDKPAKVSRTTYESSYLKLPLLKFEMLTMRACPPEPYEKELRNLMHTVKRKVAKLMEFYRAERKSDSINYRAEYASQLYNSMDMDYSHDENDEDFEVEDLLGDTRMYQDVPNRKHIKAVSARLVEEEIAKKEM